MAGEERFCADINLLLLFLNIYYIKYYLSYLTKHENRLPTNEQFYLIFSFFLIDLTKSYLSMIREYAIFL